MKKPKAVKKDSGIPVGVVNSDGVIFMITKNDGKTTSSLSLLKSEDGINFVAEESKKKIVVEVSETKKEKLKLCHNFSVSRTPNGYVMTYIRKGTKKVGDILAVARSKDLYVWTVKSEIPVDGSLRSATVYLKDRDSFELYRDGVFIRSQSSHTLSVWKDKSSLLLTSRQDYFDTGNISIIGSALTPEGILLMYDASLAHKSEVLLQAGAVIFDKNDPKRIIWRSAAPVWQGVAAGKDKVEAISPLGFVTLGKMYILYWVTAAGNVIAITIPALFKEVEDEKHKPKILKRFHGNPILTPRGMHDNWEGEGTFNPTAIEDDEGMIHILYRALGRDGISRVGYAQSKDGMSIEKRSPFPVFEPSMGYGQANSDTYSGPKFYNPSMYTSGGGWSGAEDPRAVRIDDTIYMLYVAFEGWNSMRIALTSISVHDFKAGKWHWKKPRLISSAENRSKNWLLFPEKVNGKYAILHSISPKVLIEYVDDIDTFDEVIFSPRPEGPQPGRKGFWDNLLKGSGPPPVKTEMGWLLLYHALDKRDSSKYKLGAMLLDKDDPTKVLYRSAHPILSPDMHYENDGKPGVVYASGALIRNGDLLVYYGGADKVCCVASTPVKELLKYLATGNPGHYRLKEAA